MTRFAAGMALLLLTGPLWSQPRGGIIRATIKNGTHGGSGTGEKVTLFRLREGMEPVANLQEVSGNFMIENIELEGERPYLLQVTSQGVNYNQPVSFGGGRGYEAETTFIVYDLVKEWDDATFEITMSRFLIRRDRERLRIDKVFSLENRTNPPKTFYNESGTFRFHLPEEGLEQVLSVQATSASGMSVPQQASVAANGNGYVTKTAFKPGATDVAISYEVDFSSGFYRIESQTYFPLAELLLLVAPTDMKLDATDWENLGPEPEGRFTVLRQTDMAAGSPVRLDLSGGSEQVTDLMRSSSRSESSAQDQPQGTVTQLPNNTLGQHAILVTIMGAALTFGLLWTLLPSRDRGSAGP